MATQRVSRLHPPILRCVRAEHRRPYGEMAREHRVLVTALTGHKRNMRHSLRTRETRGGSVIGRTGGGQGAYRLLTPAGLEKASENWAEV